MVVDALGDSGPDAVRGLPRDAGAPAAGRTFAPGVEDSIEPARQQVVVAMRDGGHGLGRQRRTIAAATQLGFESGHTIGKVGWVGGTTDVDAVAEHHLAGGAGPPGRATASARIPASFRRPTSRSFGHLMSA